MVLRYERMYDDVIAPARAHDYDAAHDVYSRETVTIRPHQRHRFDMGLVLSVAHGYVVMVLSRSGLANDHGIIVANAPGLVDPGFRGELGVVLTNIGEPPYTVKKGDRIAQLLVVPHSPCGIHEATEKDPLHPRPDTRDDGRFGSTGR